MAEKTENNRKAAARLQRAFLAAGDFWADGRCMRPRVLSRGGRLSNPKAVIPCSVDVEVLDVAVGRGIALIDADLKLATAPCSLEPLPSLTAREEGRAPPEVVVISIDEGGSIRLFAARMPPAFIVKTTRVRLAAVLRGERFAAVPVALSHGARGAHVTVRSTSTWGSRALSGDARFVEHGLPALVSVDPLDDLAPLHFVTSLAQGYARTIVLDAGPRFGGAPERGTPALRVASLRTGGAEAASVLATDLPLAILAAPTTDEALPLVDEAAHAARAAASSKDPLIAALGQQLAAGLAQGFVGCARPPDLEFPPSAIELDVGCPHVDQDSSLSASLRERARRALLEDKGLPQIGPRRPAESKPASVPPRRRARVVLAVLAGFALVSALAARGWSR